MADGIKGAIVYGQKELDAALEAGIAEITLCAGIYRIPLTGNTSFSRLGPVRAEVLCSSEAAAEENMTFDDVRPVFMPRYAMDERSPLSPVAAVFGAGGSFGSGSFGGASSLGLFPDSFSSGSFGSFGSGAGGHYHEYEFEFERGSFRYGSFSGSFGSFGSGAACAEYILTNDDTLEAGRIRVFGYGIELI